MRPRHADYTVVPDPKLRRWLAAGMRSVRHKPMIHGLIEVDVTGPRAQLRDYQATTKESLSFTAFIIACLGKAVDENKAVQAFRKGKRHLILFDDVDVYTLVERDVAGQKEPIPYIIRAANRKTLKELHQEIRAAQVQDVEQARTVLQVMPDLLFGPFLWTFSWIGRRHPQIWKKYVGTVGITAVGMFGEGAGWGIPPALPTLMVTLGGIGEKPVFVDGQIAIRDYLSLTISFDHNMIDGAPAARFTKRLKELIESGYALAALPSGRSRRRR
jgi:pyruvate/2-oxoglutarate dehydrogenase complex dihydrolipoamide acyltransferase (E2) component